MTETNLLSVAIENAFNALIANVHTCLPGRIESYSYKNQKATVKPLIKKKYFDGEVVELPVLTNVPVVFPRTRAAGVTFPLSRGDGVLIVFTERALERWYSTGDDSEPGDPRRFDMTDSIAIPGLFSFNQDNIASNNNDLEVQNEGQKITIKKNGDIEVGNSNLKKVITELLISLFNAHIHSGGVLPGALTGTPTIPLDPNVLHKGLLTEHKIQAESI